jgi:acetyl-CoA synthetase
LKTASTEHPVAESAIVGYPHDIKGNALYGFVILKEQEKTEKGKSEKEINQLISDQIGLLPSWIKFSLFQDFQNTFRKIMRRILRKIAEGDLVILETSLLY